jgi:hypothetical protein
MRLLIVAVSTLISTTITASSQPGQERCGIEKFKSDYSSLQWAKRTNDQLRHAYGQNLKQIITQCEQRQPISCAADAARDLAAFGDVAKGIEAIEHTVGQLNADMPTSKMLRVVVEVQFRVRYAGALLPKFASAVPSRHEELEKAENGLANGLTTIAHRAYDLADCIEPLR